MRKRIIMIFALIILAGGVYWFASRSGLWGAPEQSVYSGTIEGTTVPVQPEQGGKITEILVHEGQDVKTGDVIARLDTQAAQIALDSANDQLRQAEAKLSDLLSGTRAEEVSRLQAQLAQAQANAQGLQKNLQYEEKTLSDYNQLYASGGLSKKDLDAEQNKRDTVKAQYDSAQAQVNAAQDNLDEALAGVTQPTIQAQKAAVDVARQGVKAAQLTVDKLTIKSPINGRVQYKHVEVGQVVNAGTRLVTLIDPNDLWVKVYVPEANLNQVKVGGKAKISADAYPSRTFEGEVEWVSDQAEFTPKNVQTKEDRITLVFAVKVRIQEGKDLLKAGMPADVVFQ